MKKPLVLHIATNLNGGPGRVQLSILKFSKNNASSFSHEFIILDEKHIKSDSLELFSEYSDCFHIGKDEDFIKEKIKQAEIIQIDWWNHPLIYNFLINFTFPASRMIICSHVNGLNRPNIITESLIEFSDIFIATTKATKKHPFFQLSEKNIDHRKKLRYATFPIDFERFGTINRKAHEGFNVGYIGTCDYSKIHRNFLSMSNAVDVPKIKFIISDLHGDKDNVSIEAKKYSSEKFQFTGFVEKIETILEVLDVFGYPLNANHFGGGEQAILEAMFAGLPVVAFSNPCEEAIISHNETGILVEDEQGYSEAIKNLYLNPNERKRIGMNAQKYVKEELNPSKRFQEFEYIYKEILEYNKITRNFKTLIKKSEFSNSDMGARLFIESLGHKGSEFLQSFEDGLEVSNNKLNNIIKKVERGMKTTTKGSILQYLYFFPNDTFLNFWVDLISQEDEKVIKPRFSKNLLEKRL